MDSISDQRGAGHAGTALPTRNRSRRGLVKRYYSHQAVAGITLEVRRGISRSMWPP